MTRRIPIYLLLALPLFLSVMSCNKKAEEDPEIVEISYSNVAVEAFSLARNDSVLARLDSVFFSIDLAKALIFNADSLPRGTKVDRLQVNIKLPDLSSATIIQPDGKEIDYLAKTTDSIDFSLGDVTLRLVSYDKKVTRDYTVKVNVHNMVPDSLAWDRIALSALPGGIANPMVQKTVQFGDKACCLVTDGTQARVSFTADPSAAAWSTVTSALPADARIETFASAANALYILDSQGALYTSTDGAAWSATDVEGLTWLYGDYDGQLLAAATADGVTSTLLYPSMAVQAAPQELPVAATSELLTFESKWAETPTAIFVGGRDASGSLSDAVWAFDGEKWVNSSIDPLPQGLEGMALIPYFYFKTNKKNWVVTEYSVLLAIGGRTSSGAIDGKVYISFDNGLRWHVADDLMQLPDYMPRFSGAQALVIPSTLTSRASAPAWIEMPRRVLPHWWMVCNARASRAVTPITEWECPYIYIFGGCDESGELNDAIWRGVINRLTFKPLQ